MLIRQKIWTLSVCVLLITSCEQTGFIGLDMVQEEQFDMLYLDTLSVNFSTVLLDSVPTSTSGRLLAGHHQDSTFGDITAKAFFQVGLDSMQYPDKKKAVYQRATFSLYYDDYAYYDTTRQQTFFLYPLTEDMRYEEDGRLYRNSHFNYDTIAGTDGGYLATVTVYPRPHQHVLIEMPLDDSLGVSLFEHARDRSETILSESKFLKAYKGFVLVPDPANTAIIGFSTNTRLTVYYTEEGNEEQEIHFPIANHIYHSHIRQNRSQTAFSSLQLARDALASWQTANQVYAQGGVGVGIRIAFPTLKSLYTLGEGVYIAEALLKIRAVKGSYGANTPLPEDLSVYQIDGLNRVHAALNATFTLLLDQQYQEDTYYSLSLAAYLNSQLRATEDSEPALLLTLPDATLNGSLDRLVAGGTSHDQASGLALFVMKNYRKQ